MWWWGILLTFQGASGSKESKKPHHHISLTLVSQGFARAVPLPIFCENGEVQETKYQLQFAN
jgi:hypothetical protein